MSSKRPILKVACCDYQAARYAVMHWHYSKAMPSGKLVKLGAWEDGEYMGCVLFGRGASNNIGRPYGLKQTQVCELVRVALSEHQTPTSRIVAIALKCLRKQNPGLRLVVSYADSGQGHHGGIYQAGGWVYTGRSSSSSVRVHGRVRHRRSLNARYGSSDIAWLRAHVDPAAESIVNGTKYKYLMPLDNAMRRQVAPLAKPYPRRK